MIEHRPSRPFRKLSPEPFTIAPNPDDAPGVPPGLLEHLVEVFAVKLAPDRQQGLDGAVNVAIAMAEQRGREEVLSYLNLLANRPNS